MHLAIRAFLTLGAVTALVIASITLGATSNPGEADDCGTFTVSPPDGAIGLHPVRLVRVDYVTCYPGGIAAGVGISVDGQVNDVSGFHSCVLSVRLRRAEL